MITNLLHHLIILPILMPLMAGAVLLFIDERHRRLKSAIGIACSGALIVIAVGLISQAIFLSPAAQVYQLGNWPAPFGIVLVLDRLSALMVLLTNVLGFAALIFAQAHWNKSGQHFQSFMQFLFVGLNGAFLTGDLFNLFVFFEVMLTASYALALYGSGQARVRAGMHYVVINLIASLFFLIGAALVYAVIGSLNMADLAHSLATRSAENLLLFEVGAAILALALLTKAGMWPLNFWLTPTYSAAPAPVGAIFTILSKVGIYVILRLSLLVFGSQSGELAGFGNPVLFYGGLATLIFGFIGVLASQAMGRLAAYCVIISSGTLLAAVGSGNSLLTTGALFYMVSSTLAISAFFLLVELVERSQDTAANVLAVTIEAYGDNYTDNDPDDDVEVGIYLPATLAILGACFAISAILIIGMPPFSGFIGKFMMIDGILNPPSAGGTLANNTMPSAKQWSFVALIIISGLAILIAMTRMGTRTFWASIEGKIPKVLVIEFAPIAGLLFICFVLTIFAGPASNYLAQLVKDLYFSTNYINSVLQTNAHIGQTPAIHGGI